MGGVNQQGGVEEAVLLSFLIACGCPPPASARRLREQKGVELGRGPGDLGAWLASWGTPALRRVSMTLESWLAHSPSTWVGRW